MMLKKKYFSRGALTVIAAIFAITFLLPTVLTVTNSFMSQTELSANYGPVFDSLKGGATTYVADKVTLKFIPDTVSFSQYATVLFKSPEYLLKFWNSVILVVPIVIGQVAVAALAAYSFMRYRGLLNTRWSIILPGIFAPFSVFLLTKFMRRIPSSLIEAAKLDGASEWRIFTRICLPQCRSALYSIAILVFIDYWNMVEQPIILLSDPDKQPLSVYLSTINAGEVGIAFAVAVIYMIPSLLIFLHGEEYLVEGITHSGSVKG